MQTEPTLVIRPSGADRLVAVTLACLFELGVVFAASRPGRSWLAIAMLLPVGPIMVVAVLRLSVVVSSTSLTSRTLFRSRRWSSDELREFRVKWRAGSGCVVVRTVDGSTIELSATKALGRSGRRASEGMRDELTAWLDQQQRSV